MNLLGGDLYMTDPAIRIRTGLQNLLNPCTITSFAAVAVPPMVPEKYSQQILGQILNGQREFKTIEEANSFGRVLTTMEYIQDQIKPKLPIDWTNVLLVRDEVLKMFDQRRNVEDPVQNRCWFVRLTVHNFFRGVRPDSSIFETMNYYRDEAAAFTNYELASQVAEKLKQHGVASKIEMLTCDRRQSTITVSLEELGFTQ
jgi:hypothetical protein